MVITLTIPDAEMARVVNAICTQHDYEPIINGAPNPETKGQFAKRMVIQQIKHWVQFVETKAARETITASATAIDIT